jgi:vitamin B12 transporter
MNRSILPLTLVAAVGLTGAAMAQTPDVPAASPLPEDTFLLPGLVVTATRVPAQPGALPTPVTVLTGADLRARGIRTVADALATVPAAVMVQAGPPGGQTALFLRGGQSGYVKVLVDGVPVNDPGGAMDLADLTTDQVDRIEVVRGPTSVLYGSDAVTGVVQIFTRRGQGDPSIRVTTMGGVGERRHEDGRYGSFDANAGIGGSAGPVGYSVGGGRAWNHGPYPLNSDRRLDVLNARLDWARDAATEAALTVRFSDSDTGLPTDGAGNLVDMNARIERRSWTAGLEAGQRLGDRVVARVQLGILDRDQLSHDEPDDSADTLGVYASRLHITLRRLHAEGRVDVDLPRSVASVGLAVNDQRGRSDYRSLSEWGPTEAAAAYDRRNLGAFAQLLSEPLDRLHLTAGLRLDDNDGFGRFWTHRLGASYSLAGTRLRAALGRAFREPTFAENFGSGFGDRGSPDLVPERSRSREVGVDQRIGRTLRVGATWFDQRFQDMIQYTFAPADPDGPNYYNVGAARADGLELTGDAAVGPLLLAGSYTWLRTRVLDPGLATDASFVEGEPLLRRPAHTAALTARYRLGQGGLGLTVRHVGQREDLDFGAFPAPRVDLPAYTTIDVAAEHRLPIAAGPGWDLLVRVQNAFDARYEAIHGFPAPGRLVSVGLRLRAGQE